NSLQGIRTAGTKTKEQNTPGNQNFSGAENRSQ
ncbi:unnamed protein product, partial [marine sediment metagenome]